MKIPIRGLEKFAVLSDFSQEIREWLGFLSIYTTKRLKILFFRFEKVKDFLVDILIAKRGRYSKHFLNLSLFFLIAGAVVGAPVIADYYPTVTTNTNYSSTPSTIYASISTNELSTTTQISDKPRFEILDYEVVSGDVLGGIADKFGVSVDTIKWANNLKGDSLIPGQILRIPPVTGIVHKVKPGDTIYSVAKTYKTDAQKVVNFPGNDFADLDTFALSVGQILIVPDGVAPAAAPLYIAQRVPKIIAGGGGRFLWPASGEITQYPVSYHMALDIANNASPDIAVGDSGTVTYSGCVRYGYGCHVIVDHNDGFQTLYAHMQSLYVTAGASVARGQAIGKMGSTGRSTGIHIHFEVRINGVIVNPLGYLGK
ncbi:hypothetical protein A2773_00440 [Candidatus Gottesmanbacteria bacterium RIFCSPHIGHO2_01_FULL_39_10]|uniref:LysM domain-containing protein n=1 Tax=Candidatus Gottesmanbacteria bacterium RIFCSPHIGHO2_01_FULL_39_10 TaxID=1798375 RepID=A0A1F5ZLY1_9BACT|nr:MAG: hypothetical protein A2773_00440 [Candidatus Gottesmanbacteria bacterium RIFCSPHIGHO2_01_FULL_39_10]